MKKKMLAYLACAAAACMMTAQSSSAQDIPTGTSFCFQVEDQPLLSPWKFEDDLSGFYGRGYYRYHSSNRGKGLMEFTFNLTEAGTYHIQWHGRRDRGLGTCPDNAADDLCNDIFTELGGAWPKCKSMVKRGGWGKWFWEGRLAECGSHDTKDLKAKLAAGTHTLKIWGRSRGVALDAVSIWPDGKLLPESLCKDAAVIAANKAPVVQIPAARIYRTNDMLQFEFGDAARLTAGIYTMQGSKVAGIESNNGRGAVRIAGLPGGLYVVRLHSGEKSFRLLSACNNQ
jgi:hypothetical protein